MRRWPVTAALLIGLVLGGSVRWGAAAGLALSSHSLVAYRTCTLTATPTTTTVVTDASIRQASPTSNFGTTTTIDVASAASANRRTYVFFNLASCSPAIPATALVRLATLRLFVTALPAACRTLDLFRVSSTWTETGITWNNQPFGTTINNPPAAQASTSFTIGTPVGCANRTTSTYVSAGYVTTDVAAFVAGSQTNFGWMIRDDAEGSATARTVTFSAKQLGTVAQLPQLVVSYVTVP